jgi:hypothetical protein
MHLDDLYIMMARDIVTRSEAERPFVRYLGLVHLQNAGACPDELERGRTALREAVNMISLAPAIHAPQPVGGSAALYRIDLRDYAWDRPLDRGWRSLVRPTQWAARLRRPQRLWNPTCGAPHRYR